VKQVSEVYVYTEICVCMICMYIYTYTKCMYDKYMYIHLLVSKEVTMIEDSLRKKCICTYTYLFVCTYTYHTYLHGVCICTYTFLSPRRLL
jgi:hypothetical protein